MLKIDELNRLNPYEYMDKELEKFRRVLVKRFRRIKNAKKGIGGVVRKEYDYLYKRAYSMFLKLSKYYYEDAEGPKKPPGEDWLLDFLEDYDLLTGYQYEPEWERKRARTFEIAQSYRDANKVPDLRRAEVLLNQQVTQKAIEVVDYVTQQAYKDRGVKKVKWVAHLDNKVCAECEERNGHIYEFDKLPDKHYFCRCWLIPYENRSKNA